MKRLMNRKTLAGILATSALLASGAASAVPTSCTSLATLGAWAGLGAAGCIDPDGDSTWVNTGTSNNISNAGLTFSENDIFGQDTYTLHLNFATLNNGAGFFGSGTQPGTNQEGTLNYTVNPSLPTDEHFQYASLSSTRGINLGTSVIKDLSNTTGSWNLTSTDANSVGPVLISGQDMTVAETFSTSGSGVLTGATNTYTVNVPEPGSILLLGIGLTALVIGRKKVLMGAV